MSKKSSAKNKKLSSFVEDMSDEEISNKVKENLTIAKSTYKQPADYDKTLKNLEELQLSINSLVSESIDDTNCAKLYNKLRDHYVSLATVNTFLTELSGKVLIKLTEIYKQYVGENGAIDDDDDDDTKPSKRNNTEDDEEDNNDDDDDEKVVKSKGKKQTATKTKKQANTKSKKNEESEKESEEETKKPPKKTGKGKKGK